MSRGAGASLVTLAALALVSCGSGESADQAPPVHVVVMHHHSPQADGPAVRVPHLVGVPFDVAVRRVRKAGLEQTARGFPGTLGNPNYNGACIAVSSQSPPAGTRLPKGSTVTIVMGACKKAIAAGDGRH